MSHKSGMSVVEVSLVVAILLLLAAIALPAFFQNQHKQRAAACAMNLEAIATACRRHASEQGGFPATLEALAPAWLKTVPACPAGGTYTLGTPEGDPPACSVPGHHF
jgi:prepilin-type N-terminal cleavage/methylation domain-containing protein